MITIRQITWFGTKNIVMLFKRLRISSDSLLNDLVVGGLCLEKMNKTVRSPKLVSD